jgi:hypothetical protein
LDGATDFIHAIRILHGTQYSCHDYNLIGCAHWLALVLLRGKRGKIFGDVGNGAHLQSFPFRVTRQFFYIQHQSPLLGLNLASSCGGQLSFALHGVILTPAGEFANLVAGWKRLVLSAGFQSQLSGESVLLRWPF